MLKETKSLIEVASIDLAYARLEIAYADQPSEMLDRIGFHLNEVSRHLSELTQYVNATELSKEDITVAECEQLNCDVATLPGRSSFKGKTPAAAGGRLEGLGVVGSRPCLLG